MVEDKEAKPAAEDDELKLVLVDLKEKEAEDILGPEKTPEFIETRSHRGLRRYQPSFNLVWMESPCLK